MPHLTRWLASLGTLTLLCLFSLPASASGEDNFARCKDGLEGCKRQLLSKREKSIVTVFDRGRNLSACVEKSRECNRSWLTPEQFELIDGIWQQEKEEDRRVRQLEVEAEILADGRNFSACAHGLPECNARRLSDAQRDTIRLLIAEDVRQARSEMAEATAVESGRSTGENALSAIFGAWRAAIDGLEKKLLGKSISSAAPYADTIRCSQTRDCPVGFKCVRKSDEKRGLCKRQ